MVPSAESSVRTPPYHAVRFYKDTDTLAAFVTSFIRTGLSQSEPCLIVATREHRDEIDAQLRGQSVDVDALREQGVLTILDAHETLALFMVDGMPDAFRFRAAVTPVLTTVSAARPGARVRAYGEMVDVLWQTGQKAAALRLEHLWNWLATSHDFALLCGYATDHPYQEGEINEICGHHSHILASPSTL